jgi:hypothetical protein
MTQVGYKSTFPKGEIIRNRTAIERALETAILRLTARLQAAPRARKLHSTAFLSITDNDQTLNPSL